LTFEHRLETVAARETVGSVSEQIGGRSLVCNGIPWLELAVNRRRFFKIMKKHFFSYMWQGTDVKSGKPITGRASGICDGPDNLISSWSGEVREQLEDMVKEAHSSEHGVNVTGLIFVQFPTPIPPESLGYYEALAKKRNEDHAEVSDLSPE
jgi:hypothetical protein